MRGLWLGLLSFVLALAGTLFLGDILWRNTGIAVIVLACVFAVIAYRDLPFPHAHNPVNPLNQAPSQWKRRALPLAGVAVSGISAYSANASFLANPNETFGLAGWLWVTGIALLVVSCVAWPRGRTPVEGQEESLGWPLWEIGLFAGLVLLAGIMRVWDLNNFPFNVYGDERVTGRLAIDSYIGKSGPSVFSLLWPSVDLPGLWFATVAKSLEAGGFTLWALRLPAALLGAAMAIPFYGFMRLGWGRGAAIAGTALLAFSAVSVHYSRIALNNIATPFFWSVCFFFLLRGMRSRRPVDWAAAGLAGGLSEYGYYGTRLLPFILVAFFVYLLVTNWRQWRGYAGHFLLVLLGYIVGFGPLFARYALNPGLYTSRAEGSLTWDHIPASWADLQLMWATLWPVMAENLLGISTHGSQDVIYNAPLLLAAEGALLALGVALLAWHWRHPASFLVLLAGVGVFFTGGTLVLYGPPPVFAHWVPGFGAFFAAAAVPLWAWLASAKVWLPGRAAKIAPALVAVGLAVLGYLNSNFYFREYYANPDSLKVEAYRNAQIGIELQSAQAHYQAGLDPRYAVRILGRTEYLHNPITPYLVGGQDYASLADPERELPVEMPGGKGLVFIFMPGGEDYRALVREAHPGGKDGELHSPSGRHLFFTYILTREEATIK